MDSNERSAMLLLSVIGYALIVMCFGILSTRLDRIERQLTNLTTPFALSGETGNK